MQTINIKAIYLAAGFGQRFGSNKLLHDVDGKALFRHGLDMLIDAQKACALLSGITVVTQFDEIEQYVSEMAGRTKNLTCVKNLHSKMGISSSIKLGILSDCRSHAKADAYMFCVADEPYLKKETLLHMLSVYAENPRGILCMRAGAHRGNPVIFHKKYRQELLDLTGDMGGRQIFTTHPEELREFPVNDPNELIDIDYSKKS